VGSLSGRLGAAQFSIAIAQTFTLENWRTALNISESGHASGKLLLLPGIPTPPAKPSGGGEVQAGVHVQVEASVRVDVRPEQGTESATVFRGEPLGPLAVAQDSLEELGVDVDDVAAVSRLSATGKWRS
jgi:hypothetical protein